MVEQLRGVAPHGLIDLHTHSTVSDGTESPTDLVAAAAERGISVLALTDHDSTLGWDEARTAARAAGIRLVPGMELSTRLGGRSVHVLAYLFDPDDAALSAETRRIREARQARAQTMVGRLAADFDFGWDDVLDHVAAGATVGRPHIADALVARGHALSREDAFDTLLHPGAGYYEPIYAPSPLEGVRLVRDAGGVPVLAHPATRGIDRVIDKPYLARLVDAGLFGLEIEHRENTPEGKDYLRRVGREFGLVTTGSSDYHGAGKPNLLGENTTEPAVLAAILAESSDEPLG